MAKVLSCPVHKPSVSSNQQQDLQAHLNVVCQTCRTISDALAASRCLDFGRSAFAGCDLGWFIPLVRCLGRVRLCWSCLVAWCWHLLLDGFWCWLPVRLCCHWPRRVDRVELIPAAAAVLAAAAAVFDLQESSQYAAYNHSLMTVCSMQHVLCSCSFCGHSSLQE